MKAIIPNSVLEEIKRRSSIVEVISDFVSLKKVGRNHRGLCPFHADKNPSFNVNEEMGMYHCFGCKASGDAIRFLMDFADMSFVEAVEELGRRYGVDVPRVEGQAGPDRSRREGLYKINELAARFFGERLKKGAGAESARRYLERRGLKRETVERFGLGFAPDSWDDLSRFLKGRKVPVDLAEETGLVAGKGGGRTYDRFRNRIMFPIRDLRDKVIGFGGRILSDEEPKYINSPESGIFKKGKTLYALNLARDAIRENGSTIVVEGNFDLLLMHQYGFTNTVATLGTALTQDHAYALRRYAAGMVLLFDGDEAGKKAVDRSLELFLDLYVQPKVVLLPDGHDPDSFLSEKGPEAMRDLVENKAVPIIEYSLESRIQKAGDGREGRAAALKSCSEIVARISDVALRVLYVEFLAERLRIPEDTVLARVRHAARAAKQKQKVEDRDMPGERGDFPVAELTLLRLMLRHAEAVRYVEKAGVVDRFCDEKTARCAQLMISMFSKEGKIEAGHLLGELGDKALEAAMANEAFAEEDLCSEELERGLRECETTIVMEDIRNKREDLTRNIDQARKDGDRDLEIRLSKQKIDLNKEWNERRKAWQKNPTP